MKSYIALLRAVNVGGTGKLKMSELQALCLALGLKNVTTYIASGNVVFQSSLKSASIKRKLEKSLQSDASLDTTVFIRSHAELVKAIQDNPFKEKKPNFTTITFLDLAPEHSALNSATHQKDEKLAIGAREIYIHYPAGMSQSKLKLPAALSGTARNLNTVNKLATLVADLN